MSSTTAMPTTVVCAGGWVRLLLPGLDTPVYVRFGPADHAGLARLEPYAVCVVPHDREGAAPLPLNALRLIPLDRLTVWANGTEILPRILETLDDPCPQPELDLAFAGWNVHEHDDAEHWIARSRLAQVPDSDEVNPSPEDSGAGPMRQRTVRMARLVPPDTRPYPDWFYEQVADAYRTLSVRSTRPAQDIADAQGVNVTTVHGWVAAARKRGFLTPSPGQGRAAG